MPHHQPPLGRDASPARRRHMITFGHPYSCTPLLNAIFEFNRSPSHSEVTKIMKQTGLKRKQLTSWFWRKRKELSDPQLSGSSQLDPPSSQTNSPGGLSLQKGRVIKPYLKGYSKTNQGEEEDDEYRPPGHPVINKPSNSRGKLLTHLTRKQSASIVDPSNGGSPLPESHAQSKLYSRSSNSQSNPPGVPWTPPDGEPLLVRCRLRPLTERVLTETTRANQQNELIENELVGNSPVKDAVWSSSSIHTTFREKERDANEAFKNPNPSLPIQHSSSMNSNTSMISREPTQSDIVLAEVNEPPPEFVPINVPCQEENDLHHFQLDLEMMSGSQEHAFSTSRRPGSRKTSWLTPECQLGSSHNNAIESIPRRNSNNFRTCSGSSDPNTSNSNEAFESIYLRVSQEPNSSTTSSAELLSLGQEIHRWSDISNIDCASRYSSESLESRESGCTNAAVEDYSALLSTSPTQIPLRGSPAPQQGYSTEHHLANNDDEFRKDGAAQSFPNGLRYTSNAYRPSETSARTMNRQEEKELFNPTNSLLQDTSEIEEDPRLFMWEHHHQEFFNLMDWNPLGSFMNKSYQI